MVLCVLNPPLVTYSDDDICNAWQPTKARRSGPPGLFGGGALGGLPFICPAPARPSLLFLLQLLSPAWFSCPPLQTPAQLLPEPPCPCRGPKENWQMAPAVKTCLPLLASFWDPGFPLSCQFDRRGPRSRALNINPGPRPAVCFESPKKGAEKTVSRGRDGGEFSYLIHFGGKGQREKPKQKVSERGREGSLFLTLPRCLMTQ